MSKIELVKQAILNGTARQSKLVDEVIKVPFLGSLQIRHLLNNLGAISERYIEVGCHKGGSFCSTVFGNSNLRWAYAVDNFLSDKTQGETAEYQFLRNALYFMPPTIELRLMRGDSFEVDLKELQAPFDLYLFDGSHDEDSQRKALTYYLPVMANEFIFCVDDYDWKEVQKGTQDGIKETGVEVLFEQYLPSHKEFDNEGWHNGFYVSILKKSK